jgi:quinol monooxygenase YgiN
MIVRIVRMEFQPNRVHDFLTVFRAAESKIRNFSGCRQMEIYRDHDRENVFYTISHWDSLQHLNDYRNSEVFHRTWEPVKELFAAAPIVYSLQKSTTG